MRIWLASYPRSGNTMFRIWWHYYYGLPTYSEYRDIRVRESGEIGELLGHRTTVPPGDPLALWKTHGCEKDNFLPALYIVRDGREACVSYAHQLDVPLAQVIRGEVRFGKWCSHVNHWLDRRNRPRVLRFEEMVSTKDPGQYVENALGHAGLMIPRKEGTPPGFDELHKRHPEFFRSGRIDSWKEKMTDEDLKLFWETHGDAMRRLGYE